MSQKLCDAANTGHVNLFEDKVESALKKRKMKRDLLKTQAILSRNEV
jgi:hypothetical protein